MPILTVNSGAHQEGVKLGLNLPACCQQHAVDFSADTPQKRQRSSKQGVPGNDGSQPSDRRLPAGTFHDFADDFQFNLTALEGVEDYAEIVAALENAKAHPQSKLMNLLL